MPKNLECYLVGGAVRDQQLGIDSYDKDWVVVGATPEQMVELGFEPVGKDFPVFIHRKSGEEYALARTERKTAKGYQGFAFSTSIDITLEQDLARRDLTINAIAQMPDGTLIDPFNGLQDIKDRVLRHVSDAFIEDPVRILRVARFAAKFDFSIAPETQQLMQTMIANGEVDALVPERVWMEMHKALLTDQPQCFLQTLRDCGALKRVLPEIDDLFGIPQTAKYHPEIDSGIHTLMVVEQITKINSDPVVRFAAMVHDLGKAITPTEILPSHRGHEQRGIKLVKDLCHRLRIPKKYQSLAVAVTEYHLHMHKMSELRPETVLSMLEKTGSLKDDTRAEQFAQCCLADARGRTGFEDRDYPQIELFLQYQQAAKNVDSSAIAQQHEGGEKIKHAISQARQEAIAQIKSNYQSAS